MQNKKNMLNKKSLELVKTVFEDILENQPRHQQEYMFTNTLC